ncbi:MAG: sigma-54-dependent transcriptional regulator [Hyphomicrobiales bacterium]
MEERKTHILVIDDDEDILMSAKVILRRRFGKITILTHPEHVGQYLNDVDAVLLDMNFRQGATSGAEGISFLRAIRKKKPYLPIILMTAYGDISLAVSCMKDGASDFIVKPWDNSELIQSIETNIKISNQLKELSQSTNEDHAIHVSKSDIVIGESRGLLSVFNIVDKVAKTDANVLILGENGTGKEVIAKEIYKRSLRNNNKFVTVDLGAIPSTLFESEMFGHEKGAFTGANSLKKGRVEEATKGTLFLDEIGNLSSELQVKLLSMLQNRELFRVGGNKSIPVDIRLISATNMPLDKMIDEGTFRQDLLYRINTVVINLPALRERPEDIEDLAMHFLSVYKNKYNKKNVSGFSDSAIKQLLSHSWPGNIRELQHIIERCVILSENNIISDNDLQLGRERSNDNTTTADTEQSLNLEDIEKKAIQAALLKHKGNLSQASRELGLGRTTLYRKMTRYGL